MATPDDIRRAAYQARHSFAAYAAFAAAWPLAEHQWRFLPPLLHVEATPGARVALSGPPQHGKTSTLLLFAQWCLGRSYCDEAGRGPLSDIRSIILASYNTDRAAVLSAAIRDDIARPGGAFSLVFPEVRLGGAASERAWCLNEQPKNEPSLYATGIGGGTGQPCQLWLIDDYVKGPEEAQSSAYQRQVWSWYTGVVEPRMQVHSRAVVGATRWRHDDFPGRLLQQGGWHLTNLPAIGEGESPLWPDRYPLAYLREQRQRMGPAQFEIIYQGRPTPDEGAFVKRADIDRLSYNGEPMICPVMATAWDTAEETGETNCWTAGFRGGIDRNGVVWVADIYLRRVEIADLVRSVWAGLGGGFDEYAVVEKASSGRQALQLLSDGPEVYGPMVRSWPGSLPRPGWLAEASDQQLDHALAQRRPLYPVTPREGKEDRARRLAGWFDAGIVRLPRRHPLYEEVVRDLVQFPRGERKDTLDALHHLVKWCRANAVTEPAEPVYAEVRG